ncbi:MAG: cupin domain-containing protein [Rhodobacteraceae bacterium]|nr:cupin domain-containing protein [Paracoccaceae bacterium]
MKRPPEILRWEDIEGPEWSYKGRSEQMGRDADYSTHFGFDLLGIHHVRLEPGRRTSLPHAESNEDEFIFVIEGTPDVWIDGHLHRLLPGDAVGFKAGNGVAHTFLNNSDTVVRLIVAGDMPRAENRIVYPMNPDRRPLRDDWWEDAPRADLGPHDGKPDPR